MFQNIPTVTKHLLIINVLAYIATELFLMGYIDLASLGGLHYWGAPGFHVYQFVTYQFLHGGLSHVFWNMFALWMFGVVMERVWGPQKFLFYYITCGIGAGLTQELVQVLGLSFPGTVTIGASGAVYAILLAFGMTFPNERIYLLIPPVPIKAKWFVAGYAAIELWLAVSSSHDGVAHTAHLGGMLFGYFMIRYWNSHPNSRLNQQNPLGLFEEMKRNFEQRHGQRQQPQQPRMKAERGGATRQDDRDYNARKQARQAEVDAILDKIRKSGYDSLTKEEKQRLFDASKEI